VRILLGDERELLGTAEAISPDGALQVRLLSPSPPSQSPPIIHVRAADVIHVRE
jgi:BirA family biotin operon repressor/biotin-[acetyl-CoA-carboxylase] ligase